MKIQSAVLLIASIVPLLAATPAPKAAHKPIVIPTPTLPKVALHTEYVVEVNKKGQVVRVKSGKSAHGCAKTDKHPNHEACTFNAQTYGNVLQMWIRHPDGSAEVGLYQVNYDYDPHSQKVRRSIELVKAGGNWGNATGAATDMMNKADAETRAYQERMKNSGKNLPPLNQIVAPTKSPAP